MTKLPSTSARRPQLIMRCQSSRVVSGRSSSQQESQSACRSGKAVPARMLQVERCRVADCSNEAPAFAATTCVASAEGVSARVTAVAIVAAGAVKRTAIRCAADRDIILSVSLDAAEQAFEHIFGPDRGELQRILRQPL